MYLTTSASTCSGEEPDDPAQPAITRRQKWSGHSALPFDTGRPLADPPADFDHQLKMPGY